MLLRPTALSEKIDPVHMDEALARVCGVAVTAPCATRARVLTSKAISSRHCLGFDLFAG
ncbi:MAG: hypothetical protein HRT56_05535 [Coraliomargarita sp.]|nr:hypothetical protein [Coraliomargarita sp.]